MRDRFSFASCVSAGSPAAGSVHWRTSALDGGAIAAVGNYGEIYQRGFHEQDGGEGSALKLPRGENRLARDGGLMLPLPLK